MNHTEFFQWWHNRWASSIESEARRPIPLPSTHCYQPGLITHTVLCQPYHPHLHNIPKYPWAAAPLVLFDPEGEGTMVLWKLSSYTCTLWQSMTPQMKIKQILLAQWINSCHDYSTNSDGLKHGHCVANCWFDSLSLVLQKCFKSLNYQVNGSKNEETLHHTRMSCWCAINVGVPQTMYMGCTGTNHYMKV